MPYSVLQCIRRPLTTVLLHTTILWYTVHWLMDEKICDRVYSLLSPPAAFPATAHRASSTASIPAHTVSLAAAWSLVSFAVAADPNLKEGFRMDEIECTKRVKPC